MEYSVDIEGRIQLTKERPEDAGLDIYCSETYTIPPYSQYCFSTGLKVAIPFGFVGLVWSRSGLALKKGIEVGAGCIDSGYRGEVKVLIHNLSDKEVHIPEGTKLAQLLTVPISLESYTQVPKLSNTDRGEKGFGSSDKLA